METINTGLTKAKLTEMLKEYRVPGNPRSLAQLLRSEQNDKSYEHQCHNWINQLYSQDINIEEMRNACLDLLEKSDLLDQCESEQDRETMIGHFSTFLNILDNHLEAKQLLENDEAERFVDSMLKKLSCSCFVFHPRKNFNILSALFLRKPELLDSRIPELLEIIATRDISLWRQEPVRTSLVKVLEFYLAIMEQRIDRTQEKGATLWNTTRTLACQLELMHNGEETLGEVADMRLNCVRLYIMASFAEHLAGNTLLLDKALAALTGQVDVPPTHALYRGTDETLPALLIEHARTSGETPIQRVAFERDGIKVVISDEGIQLLGPGIDTAAQGKAVLPSFLPLEHQMQLYMEKRTTVSFGKKHDRIPLFGRLWNEAVEMLFNREKKGVFAVSDQRKHRVGERVKIYVDTQASDEKFHCVIADEIGGEGYIGLSDIVSYRLPWQERQYKEQARLFRSYESGRPHTMMADIVEVDDEGMFRFSMLEALNDLMTKADFQVGELMTCSVGGDRTEGNSFLPAVSDEGFGVSVVGLEKAPTDLKRGDLIHVSYLGLGPGTFHITAEYVDRPVEELMPLNLSDSFHFLVENFLSEGELQSTAEETTEETMGVERMLSITEMKQLIRIVDRYATIDRDYVKAYNYLGFARVLSLLIGWEEQARYYKGRMTLMELLYDFSQNDKVDIDQLGQMVEANLELLGRSNYLRERFLQIQLLACMGRPDENEQLWQSTLAENPRVKELADLVLTYNLLKAHDMENQARDVMNRIKAVMDLKNCESGLKQYGLGIETDTMEYKSSIVYFAREPKPNLKKQSGVILNVIASFLNNQGGTLCLGVNDQGMGVGLELDLAYQQFGHDRGKYVNYISQLITSNFGSTVAPYISVGFDTENTDKDVCLIRVKPYALGCPRRNDEGKEVWYVRIDAHKETMDREAFERFNREFRRELLAAMEI